MRSPTCVLSVSERPFGPTVRQVRVGAGMRYAGFKTLLQSRSCVGLPNWNSEFAGMPQGHTGVTRQNMPARHSRAAPFVEVAWRVEKALRDVTLTSATSLRSTNRADRVHAAGSVQRLGGRQAPDHDQDTHHGDKGQWIGRA